MGKKKKKNKAREGMIKELNYFANYAKRHNKVDMDHIRDDLEDMIRKIEKEDRKFNKLKSKVKHGKCKIDINDCMRTHPIGTRRSFVQLFNSTDFIEVLRYISKNAKPMLIVTAQMVATLIVLVLGCKKLRETIPVNTIRRMQSTYDFCSNIK